MNAFRSFLHSFLEWKVILTTLSIDVVSTALITALFWGYGSILGAKAYALSGGQSVEQLKNSLLTGTLENSQIFLAKIKLFTILFIGGAIAIIIITVLVYSLSRAILWYHLMDLSFQHYWKWNGMAILLGFMLLPYTLLVFLFRYLVNSLIPIRSQLLFSIVDGISISIFIYLFLILTFAITLSFVEKYRVWEAIGHGFYLLKKNRSKLWKTFLFALLIGLLINIKVSLLQTQIPSPLIFAIVRIGLFLLFLSWLRIYFVKTIV